MGSVLIVNAVSFALQALTFPLRLRLVLPPLGLLRIAPPPPPHSFRGAWPSGRDRRCPSHCVLWGLLSPLLPFSGDGGGGGGRVLLLLGARGGVGDPAASSSTGVAVVGSSRSQEFLVLAAPSSIASSVSAERDRRSRSCGIGESTEACSRSRSSRSSPSRCRESRGGRRCGPSRSGGLHG